MTMSETRSAFETAGVLLDELASVHPGNFSKGGDDRNGGHAEQICDLPKLSYQTVSSVSGLQQIQRHCSKAELIVPATVFEVQKLIA